MIYHIITNGQNAMPSYEAQVSREERWAIINYLRVLQRAKNANPSDLSAIIKEPGKNAR
jgi:mono/diheme cytochrome c family protein